MESHYELSNIEFENQFKNATLDPKLFNHEAHLRLAWIYIKNDGIDKAVEQVCNQTLNYTNYLGATDKYNETVTIAAVRAVYHFILKFETNNFKDFINEFPHLKFNFKELLAQHYQVDIFNSEVAKSSFLAPDLLPFD